MSGIRSKQGFTVLDIAQGKMPRSEKQVEQSGDKFMATMGFDSVHFSQPRATKQTRGIPDRKYYNNARGVSCWWEAKAEDGRQSEDQRRFQRACEECFEVYLLGTEESLIAWCQEGCPRAVDCHFWQDQFAPERFRYRPPKR